MALRPWLTRAAMAHTKKATREKQADLIKCVVVRIESATDPHEVGIASNRDQESHGEYVPGLYTPPVTPWEWVAKEVGSLTFGRALPLFVIHDWGEVVTSVTVGEPAVDHLLTLKNCS